MSYFRREDMDVVRYAESNARLVQSFIKIMASGLSGIENHILTGVVISAHLHGYDESLLENVAQQTGLSIDEIVKATKKQKEKWWMIALDESDSVCLSHIYVSDYFIRGEF